ncbi:hypothetical protein JCM10908_005811 [Rhodotorula pacifica]|uniref:uncharacterized protein n=1 Tax=Rhodotorula pacifica TaxID=1495444 RepID=UPI003171022E
MQNQTDLYAPKEYRAIDFIIGLVITLASSLTNALGLNVTKLDYNRQAVLPPNQRRPDYLRPFWLLGLILYIASQVVGSTLALNFMRAEYVAPLGASSLIFNVLFAYLLVGTSITKLDVAGTLTIIVGVVGVVVFGNIRIKTDAIDAESNLSLSLLKEIWGRPNWIIYLAFLEFTTVVFWWLSRIAHEVCMARVIDERGDDRDGSGVEAMLESGGGRRVANPYEGQGFVGKVKSMRDAWHAKQGKVRRVIKQTLERWCQSRPDAAIRQLAAFAWAVTSGLLSGQTLILAKSGVKLVTSAINKSDPNEANQFTSPLSWLIVILLVVCAVTQVYALQLALKCFDATFVVPVLFATYTVGGFLNSLVYLNQTDAYRLPIFLMIWLSIAVLIAGVVMLSLKKQPRVRPARSASSASSFHAVDAQDPFDDPEAGPDSPGKPGFARAFTQGDAGDVEAGKATLALPGQDTDALQEAERRKGQGWLSRFFGGGAPATAGTSTPSAAGSPTLRVPSSNRTNEMSQAARRRQSGLERLDDRGSSMAAGSGAPNDADSVLASERTSQRDAEELEMDEVDDLGRYAESVRSDVKGSRGEYGIGEEEDDDDDDFGNFERATGAQRIDSSEMAEQKT